MVKTLIVMLSIKILKHIFIIDGSKYCIVIQSSVSTESVFVNIKYNYKEVGRKIIPFVTVLQFLCKTKQRRKKGEAILE
jgi:hypothetical protein